MLICLFLCLLVCFGFGFWGGRRRRGGAQGRDELEGGAEQAGSSGKGQRGGQGSAAGKHFKTNRKGAHLKAAAQHVVKRCAEELRAQSRGGEARAAKPRLRGKCGAGQPRISLSACVRLRALAVQQAAGELGGGGRRPERDEGGQRVRDAEGLRIAAGGGMKQ